MRSTAVLAAAALAVAIPVTATASFRAPGLQLTPSNPTAPGAYGESVAVSADGKTALVGGDHVGATGGAVVYVRSGSGWSMQTELTPSDLQANASFGAAVSLSADGNTALIGDEGLRTVLACEPGGSCSSISGLPAAVWVFVRSGSTWTQQGHALRASSVHGASGFGASVALSADGNTALIGGPSQDGRRGAVWVFTRAGSTWSLQASALSPNDQAGPSGFGSSVSLSWDGSTALIGGPLDNPATVGGLTTHVGAAWVFTRTGSSWKQQGPKLTGPGGVVPEFGHDVALSADGAHALITGAADGSGPAPIGAVWAFARVGPTWAQEGAKLVLNDPAGVTNAFGSSLALSASGDTALIGGYTEGYGDVWEFVRAGGGWKEVGSSPLPRLGGLKFGQAVAVTPAADTAFVSTSNGAGPGSVWVLRSSSSAPSAPAVARVAPASAAVGAQVTISGRNLKGAGAVEFGQVGAQFTVVSSTKIRATVPANAATAAVGVVTPDGTATSGQSFTVVG